MGLYSEAAILLTLFYQREIIAMFLEHPEFQSFRRACQFYLSSHFSSSQKPSLNFNNHERCPHNPLFTKTQSGRDGGRWEELVELTKNEEVVNHCDAKMGRIMSMS